MKFYKHIDEKEKIKFSRILVETEEEKEFLKSVFLKNINNENEMYEEHQKDKICGERNITHRQWNTPTAVLANSFNWAINDFSIFKPRNFIDLYLRTFDELFEKFGKVYINKTGSFTPVDNLEDKDYKEIFFDESLNLNNIFDSKMLYENKIQFSKKLNINENILLLENDPELDTWITRNLYKKYNFNYILNSKILVNNGMFEACIFNLKEKNKFPIHILEYTTAYDFERLKKSVEISLKNDVKRFTYILSTNEKKEDLKEYFKSLSLNKDILVDIIEEKDFKELN